jgi:hypothetical protein
VAVALRTKSIEVLFQISSGIRRFGLTGGLEVAACDRSHMPTRDPFPIPGDFCFLTQELSPGFACFMDFDQDAGVHNEGPDAFPPARKNRAGGEGEAAGTRSAWQAEPGGGRAAPENLRKPAP